MFDDNLDLWVLPSPFFFIKQFTAGLCLFDFWFFTATAADHDVQETCRRAE